MPQLRWSFFRAGGFDQVRLSTGADLVALEHLDQKLWVALACPTKGLEFDQRTLELLDTDKDGRIRAPELIAATKWAGAQLRDVEQLAKGSESLPLSAINDATAEGKSLLSAAKTILAGLGRPDADRISVSDMSEAVKAFEQMALNGDGVVPPTAVTDAKLAETLADILDTEGGVPDKSGKPGIDAAKTEAFFKDVADYAAWHAKGATDAAIQPLKADTAAAHDAFAAVKAKVDDYFARCRLAAFDPRAQAALNREEKEYLALAAKDLSLSNAEVAPFPLATIAAGKPLPLSATVNPAWAEKMAVFASKVVTPVLGAKESITDADWLKVSATFAAYEGWQASKAGANVEKLGVDKVKAYADGKKKAAVLELIAADAAKAEVGASIASVEQLVRYNRDLLKLANNFVAFRDFYTRADKAVFQAGTLYLDQRACDLVLRVDDAGRHASMAPLSRAYLVYCDCKRPSSGETLSIVAAITAGDVDNLMVGRNGIFYDRKGRDWDATITKIVANPISIAQAFWSPYKKVVSFIEEQVNKRIAAAEEAGHAKAMGGAEALTIAAETGKAAEKPAAKPFDIGIVAALGVAVGGITAAMGALLQAFFGLGIWMPLGVVGLILLISGPSMLLAWLKLRQRNLGPILDANGWAVNAQALVNVPLGASLTSEAELPEGSSRDLVDPFAEKKRPVKTYMAVGAVIVLILMWFVGSLDGFLPKPIKSTTVMGDAAPAADQAKPSLLP